MVGQWLGNFPIKKSVTLEKQVITDSLSTRSRSTILLKSN